MQRRELKFKIVVLGDEMVGKTSLVRKYVDDKFQENYIPTIGSDFTIKKINLGSAIVQLNIWDIGGQKQYENRRSFYLRGAQGVFIVYDVTREQTYCNVSSWFATIKDLMARLGYETLNDVPIIILANKMDLLDARSSSNQHGKNLAIKLGSGFFETSAKTGLSVNKAFLEMGSRVAISAFKNMILSLINNESALTMDGLMDRLKNQEGYIFSLKKDVIYRQLLVLEKEGKIFKNGNAWSSRDVQVT